MRHPSVRPAGAIALLLVTALAACASPAPAPGAASPATSPPPTPTSFTPPIVVAPTVPASPTPGPSTIPGTPTTRAPVPSVPPAALLGSAGGDPVPGELGSYTWLGAGSDAPWIVVPARQATRLPAPYRIDLEPSLPPAGWIVVWAPIARGQPGMIAGHAQGTGSRIEFTGPDGSGPWSLRLEADFGAPGRATWYWRLAPRP